MFEYEAKISSAFQDKKEGSVEWSSPSNIALVKYWGKRHYQLPENPNISFSLDKSRTFTRIDYRINLNAGLKWNFKFEGKKAPEFESRLGKFLIRIKEYLPYLEHLHLYINSYNTFPHSTGIASSASAMSALALGLLDIGIENGKEHVYSADFFQKASFLARIGSGSASRSVYPFFSIWGATDVLKDSSDEYASALNLEKSSFFCGLKDAIHIVSSEKKHVSSSIGHDLMNTNPYSTLRYSHARKNLNAIVKAIHEENKREFIRITENEALSLHGLMMSSEPGYILIKKGTIEIINQIREFREATGSFITFTLDAGPNVHVIYHDKDKEQIEEFIKRELQLYTENNKIIWDGIGNGPQKIPL